MPKPKPIVVCPSDAAKRFLVRFPEGMRERIFQIAKDSHRSTNAEIIARLEKSIRDDPNIDLLPAVIERFVDVDGWIPTEGQFVYKLSTDGKNTKTFGTLKAIFINGRGELEATIVNNWVGEFNELLSMLRPVIVK